MRGRQHGVADELEAGRTNVAEGAERLVGALVLGPRVDQRALRAGERQALVVAFQQVLADLRTDELDQIADVAEDRVVAPHRMAALAQVVDAHRAQRAAQQGQRPEIGQPRQAGQGEQHAGGEEGVTAEQRQVHPHGSGISSGAAAHCTRAGGSAQ
ncbi:hypothetical protein D9M71_507900 [compost metagenome]